MSSSVGIFRSNNRWFQGNRSDCTASKASHANITRLSSREIIWTVEGLSDAAEPRHWSTSK